MADHTRGAPADFSGRVIPNPKNIKPVLDTDIKANPKDKSDPKPPHGFAYFAEPYHPKDELIKKNIDNAPLDNHITPDVVRSFKHGTDYVPETGLAILHKGEKVVTAKDNMAEKKHDVSLYRAMHHLNKGGLHRALGVKEGEKIPADKLAAAKNSKSEHVRHMANFAATMSGFSHKKEKE
jgi:hypothetical protein